MVQGRVAEVGRTRNIRTELKIKLAALADGKNVGVEKREMQGHT